MNMKRDRTDREKAMLAAARMAAHYVAAAVKTGADKGEIGAALADVVRTSGLSEIWVTDEHGRIVFGPGDMDFVFPGDPAAGTQAAPFAALLQGTETVVIQDPQPREIDGAVFQYVGVGGVDRPRIVQVGLAAGGS